MLKWSIAVALLLLTMGNASAADRYWIATTTANWNNTANWSDVSGGTGGFSVPGNGDIAKFDGNGKGNCTLDATVDVRGIDVQSGYTGTISQGDYSITVGSSNASFAGGTFSGGAATITINGTITISGTAFTSTTRTLILNGNFTITGGSFAHNSGLVQVNTTCTITGSITLSQLEFSGASTMTVTVASGTTLTVLSSLTYAGSASITVNTGNIHAQGDIILGNTSAGGGGNATLVINGTGTHSIYGYASSSAISRLPHVEINKTGGTLRLSNNMTVAGNWTYTAGTVDYGTSGVIFATTKTISGSLQLYNIAFIAGTYTLSSGTTLTANGLLQISGANACTINGSSSYIDAMGDVTVNNTGSGGGGDATIRFTGTGTQTFTGNGITNTGRVCKVVINKTSGTLNLASTISCANDWTYTQGTVSAGSSTVAIGASVNLDAQGTSGTMSFNNLTIYSGTTTLTGDVSAAGALTINSGTTLSAGSSSISVGGDWTNNGTFTYGTSTVTFDGTSTQNLSNGGGLETFYRMGMNNVLSKVVLNSPVRITTGLLLTNGSIQTTSTNLLTLHDDVTVSGGSNTSYVSGPMKKIGNDAFVFPLGNTGSSTSYHPLTITAPSSTSDEFIACYYPSDPAIAYGSALATGIDNITTCEYWTLEQAAGTSTVTPTITYNDPSCGIDPYDGIVTRWDGLKWTDHGNAGYTVNGSLYSITASTAISSFSPDPAPLAFGIKNRQYYAVLKKKLDGGYYTAVNGNLKFKFDEEYKDSDNTLTYSIYTDMHSLVSSLPSQSVQYGDNRYTIDLTSIGSMTSGYYVLEVQNEKNEKWYMRFKY